jgi:hypothetical protein
MSSLLNLIPMEHFPYRPTWVLESIADVEVHGGQRKIESEGE